MAINLQENCIFEEILCFFFQNKNIFGVFLKKKEAEGNCPDNPSENIETFYVLV